MLRLTAVISSVFFLALVFAVPNRRVKRDNCGAITEPAGKWFLKSGQNAASVFCELCLDLIEIAKMYEECGEETARRQLDTNCIKKFGNGTLPTKLCESYVDEIMYDLINDTENINTGRTCDRVLHVDDCHYSINGKYEYKLY
ncbi:unnamed protein product, partial [Mesorhabditis belari]|uniref:Saposin B-type domain-containing protein n=1 Tax=Mesorhabditis belari TaxID=2138241 RepID=A0AAF3FNK6_9BILA